MLEDPGIDPGTSHMQSERSTTWANPPDISFKILYLKFNFRIREDPGIDPGTSHMQSERSTTWANPPYMSHDLKIFIWN